MFLFATLISNCLANVVLSLREKHLVEVARTMYLIEATSLNNDSSSCLSLGISSQNSTIHKIYFAQNPNSPFVEVEKNITLEETNLHFIEEVNFSNMP